MSLCAGCGVVIVADADGNGLCVACEAALAGGGCGWPEVDEIGAAEVAAAREGV